MKRFITYLYEYNQGRKIKNTGFVRVDIRGDIVNMEVCVRNYIRTTEVGRIYGLVQEEKLTGIDLDEIKMRGGQSDKKLILKKNCLADSDYSINDVVGIAICFENDGYLASCWKDEWAERIATGEFFSYIKEVDIKTEEVEDRLQTITNTPVMPQNQLEEEICQDHIQENAVVYKKIELNQIRELPSSNWHLCNNSFLVHGAFNYGYLLLRKERNEDGERIWLGVPGYYEKPEMLMAVLFGFPEFEPVPKAAVDMEMNIESMPYNIEKNQEPKTGIFGAWFVKLDK